MNHNLSITIRKARLSDADTIVDFNLKMALETENLELEKNILHQGIIKGLKNPQIAAYFVAQHNNQIVGSLMITKEWSDWRNCYIAWIQSVYVRPDFRKRGVFAALYQSIKKQMKQKEFGGIRLYVDKSNINAIATYSKLGMNGNHYQLFEEMF